MGPKVVTMSVSMTPGMKARVEEAVRKGGFTSTSEVVRAALADWLQEWEAREAWVAHVRARIQESVEAYERGDYVTLETDEDITNFLNDIMEESRAERAAKAAPVRRVPAKKPRSKKAPAKSADEAPPAKRRGRNAKKTS